MDCAKLLCKDVKHRTQTSSCMSICSDCCGLTCLYNFLKHCCHGKDEKRSDSLSFVGELLESLPPGVDEAVAISKVVQLARSEEYMDFTHVIFDTAPTGHTLRLLTLPEFLDATIGKLQLDTIYVMSWR